MIICGGIPELQEEVLPGTFAVDRENTPRDNEALNAKAALSYGNEAPAIAAAGPVQSSMYYSA